MKLKKAIHYHIQSITWLYLSGLLWLYMLTFPCYAQISKARNTYPNGQRKYKGKYINCYSRENKYTNIIDHEKRPFGKWIFYYPSGVISEIRQYTEKVKSCKAQILKEGEWKYFNKDGIQYRMERYVNDTLIFAEIDIYEEKSMVGKITLTDQSKDTVFYAKKESTQNLIPNPSFDQYLYPSIPIINDGKNQIEDLIPYWFSPDQATPDYYNPYRKVAGIPQHFDAETEGAENNGYVGLMLFLGEKIEPETSVANDIKIKRGHNIDYTESIQSKLIQKLTKEKTYCFKAQLLLSRNAGYSIDRFEVFFSENPTRFSYTESPGEPSLSFTNLADIAQNWTTLCQGFTATGNETYITLGRFSQLEETTVRPQLPKQYSELEINGAAYYLIDDLQLFEVASLSACGCTSKQKWSSDFLNRSNFEEINLDGISVGSRYILSKIHFDFDQAKIKDTFIPELNRLLNYLKSNAAVRIIIYGHTDDAGTDIYNQNLSEERAGAIKEWLMNHGIEAERIEHEGMGNRSSLVENTSEANRQINRRVEIEIVSE